MRGVLVMVAAGAALGRSGRGDLTLVVSGLAIPRSVFEPLLAGVVGHEDRSRGVPLMACS